MPQYFQVSIQCDQELGELLQVILFEFDCFGTQEDEHGFIAFFSADDVSKSELSERLDHLEKYHSFTFEINTLKHTNWNAKWESNYQPIYVDNYCAIYAPFHQKKGNYKHELIINPEMAFGTGHHETTQLMVELMQDLSINNKKVLDLGSGTGILAIIAKKESAKEVTAVDIDEKAYQIMQENFIKNQVNVSAKLGTINQVNSSYDIVLANINRNVLIENSKQIFDKLKPNGLVVISGFYSIDAPLLSKLFSDLGLLEIKRKEKNNWCSIIFRK